MNGIHGDLYLKIVEVTGDYLGPASKRFIDRQIINHLNKQPEEISDADMDSLIEWTTAAMALLTEDKHMVENYKHRLKTLKGSKQAAGNYEE